MILIDKLKKGDIFYRAHTTGVIECRMEEDTIQKYGSFSVLAKERNNKMMIISKEDYSYLFHTREEAEERRLSLPNEDVDELLKEDRWLEMLFYVYKTYMTDGHIEAMKKAVEIKIGKILEK